jgi:hypothetical protein
VRLEVREQRPGPGIEGERLGVRLDQQRLPLERDDLIGQVSEPSPHETSHERRLAGLHRPGKHKTHAVVFDPARVDEEEFAALDGLTVHVIDEAPDQSRRRPGLGQAAVVERQLVTRLFAGQSDRAERIAMTVPAPGSQASKREAQRVETGGLMHEDLTRADGVGGGPTYRRA